MADLTDRQHVSTGNAALAALLPADQPARPSDEPDPADTTSILQGSQAFYSKASRNGAWRAFLNDPFGLYAEAKLKKEERDAQEAQEARELANLARWNEQKTVVGGVEMTNGEAQAARQRVIDNGDHYAEWAVRQGYIREDEKADFIEAMRRKHEFEDRRGRGILSAEDARKEQELDRSRMGRGLDAVTGHAFLKRCTDLSSDLQSAAGNTLLRPDLSADAPKVVKDTTVFQDYDAARRVAAVAPATSTAPKVSATGLEI